MSNKRLTKNKIGDKFNFGVNLITLAIAISMLAFMNEGNKITGFATANYDSINAISQHGLREFNDINSLESLGAGSYYIDSKGVVYWTDDESWPVVGKVKLIDEIQKNRQIYVDKNGNIGYLLKVVSINNNENEK